MRMIKCDRCGYVNESGDKIIVYENSTALSDCKQELDLCDSCKKQLWQFFMPIPQVAKADQVKPFNPDHIGKSWEEICPF